jgi:hypothetical protein
VKDSVGFAVEVLRDDGVGFAGLAAPDSDGRAPFVGAAMGAAPHALSAEMIISV